MHIYELRQLEDQRKELDRSYFEFLRVPSSWGFTTCQPEPPIHSRPTRKTRLLCGGRAGSRNEITPSKPDRCLVEKM
jgi:hypothetical protein